MQQTFSRNTAKQMHPYRRLLRYVRPYWFRLTLGIVAGLLVGSSLFFSIILIPRLAGSLDTRQEVTAASQAELARKIAQAAERPELTPEERVAAVNQLLSPADNDPKLTEMINRIRKTVADYHLPVTVEGYRITVEWPYRFSFDMVSPGGRLAWQLLAVYMIAFVLLWALKNVSIYLNHYCMAWVGSRVVADLRDAMFSKIVNQSLCFFGKVDVGQLISRMTNDTGAIQNAVSTAIADLTKCPLEVLACVAAIVYVGMEYHDYSLPVIMFLGLPLVILPVMILRRQVRKIYRQSLSQIALVFSKMHETFTCIRIIKAYNTEAKEINEFKSLNYLYFRKLVRVLRPQLLMSPMMELVTVTAVLVFLVYSYERQVSLSQIFSLLAPAFMIYGPIKELARVSNSLQTAMAAADRFFELMDTHEELPEAANPVEFREFREEIAVNDVVFSYDDHRILDGVSFKIRRGSVVAVVGETGSGKTTIANLIARFYDVKSGSITIDGVDVRQYSQKSLHQMIGIVNQESILFNDTIANNISYGCPNATREEIIEAAKQANAHQFIVDGRHAEGYDTVVGEKGFKLSGGEKQRVAIARAILKNPPILILDEATSALDTVTERLVQDALNNVMTNRTVFAIAHRLSTIQDADMIIVLEKGHIIESGTHEELLALNGNYRRLHDTQFAPREEKNADAAQ